MRSDTERNRQSIIKAASKLAAKRGNNVRMQDVAEQADLSTATAYRHFASVEDVLAEFRFSVGLTLRDFSLAREETGVELLEVVSRRWIELVMKHGRAMVYTRSNEGYLKRLRASAPYLTIQADALEIPLRQAANEVGVSDIGEIGMFFWNMFFDPREIFDLHETVGLSTDQLAAQLVRSLLGALQNWGAVKSE